MKIDHSRYLRSGNIPAHTSAGGVVARRSNGRVLIALTEEVGLPRFALPKGRVKSEDTLPEAAVRETAEETGLRQLTRLGFLGQNERPSLEKTAWKTTHYYLFVTDHVTL